MNVVSGIAFYATVLALAVIIVIMGVANTSAPAEDDPDTEEE